jgi:hypothetical protein
VLLLLLSVVFFGNSRNSVAVLPYNFGCVLAVLPYPFGFVLEALKSTMPTTTNRSVAIQELEDITNERARLKTIRDELDSPDEDEDDLDDMYEYQLELIKNNKYYNKREPY